MLPNFRFQLQQPTPILFSMLECCKATLFHCSFSAVCPHTVVVLLVLHYHVIMLLCPCIMEHSHQLMQPMQRLVYHILSPIPSKFLVSYHMPLAASLCVYIR